MEIPARAPTAILNHFSNQNHFLAPTNYTGSARASRGRVGSFKILFSLNSDESTSTDAKILSTDLRRRVGDAGSSRWGMRNDVGRSAGVGRSVSGIRDTIHAPDQRPACSPVIRSRLSQLTSPSLRHLDWGFLVRILRRVGYGKLYGKLRLLKPAARVEDAV